MQNANHASSPAYDPAIRVCELSQSRVEAYSAATPCIVRRFMYGADGFILPNIYNAVIALHDEEICLAHFTLAGEQRSVQFLSDGGEPVGDWHAVADADIIRLRYRLEVMGFPSTSPQLIADALDLMSQLAFYKDDGEESLV